MATVSNDFHHCKKKGYLPSEHCRIKTFFLVQEKYKSLKCEILETKENPICCKSDPCFHFPPHLHLQWKSSCDLSQQFSHRLKCTRKDIKAIWERFKRKKGKKKLIKISFRYVRVAKIFEKLVFFSLFFPTYFE